MGSNHQLGIGAEDDAFEPVLLTGVQVKDKNVVTVSSGGQHSVFVVSAPKVIKNGVAKPAATKVNAVVEKTADAPAAGVDTVTEVKKDESNIIAAPAAAPAVVATKKNNKRK